MSNIHLQIYRPLIFPYTFYGTFAWGQAAQRDLKKNLTLQKRALRLISFSNDSSLYFFEQSTYSYAQRWNSFRHNASCDVSTKSTPRNIRRMKRVDGGCKLIEFFSAG